MYIQQGNMLRKSVELAAVFIALFLLDAFVEAVSLRTMQPSPFIIIILLFSLRYGTRMGFSALGCTVMYHIAAGWLMGGDLFLLFYSLGESKWFFLYFLIAAIAGNMSTAWRERYQDVQFVNEELKEEQASLKGVLEQVSATNHVLEERLLQSETSISSVYQMTQALNQENMEVVTNEAAAILSSYFQAESFGIYHVDRSKGTLRIKVRLGQTDTLPQTIFIDEAKDFFTRLFTENSIVIKRSTDEAAAPVIAGPILIQGEIRQVLIIQRMDLYHLTEHNIQMLYWLLQIISDGLERADAKALMLQRKKLYPNTNIYYKKYFDEYVGIERHRQTKYGQPFAVFEIQLEHMNHDHLMKVNTVITRYLREVDRVGFDLGSSRLLFLLSGTEERYVEDLKQRITDKIHQEVYDHAGA